MTEAERGRLQEVARFMELDSRIKSDLDDIVNLAADICGAPIAIISIIDEHTQWFKASKGITIPSNLRENSFCQYTIEQNEILIVPDARIDERFQDFSFVSGEPYIKFYAGANLTTRNGFNAGTLCVLDVHPKNLTPQQENTLRILSRQVINLLELNWSVKAADAHYNEVLKQKKILEDSELQLKAFFNSSKDLFVLLNPDMLVLAFNKSAENYIRDVSGKQLEVETPLNCYLDEQSNKVIRHEFRKALKGRQAAKEWEINPGRKRFAWIGTSMTPVYRNNEIVAVAMNVADITLRKLGEEQLRLKNEALQHIAVIQSHEIRRPVASLQGLLGIIRMENEKPHDSLPYFDMIETAVTELDTKIRDVVSESEITLSIKASLF